MPQFYDPSFSEENPILSPEESHHCISVLRNKPGDTIKIINGMGSVFTGQIVSGDKKATEIKIHNHANLSDNKPGSIIVLAPVKSSDRIEWFIEKATEIGVSKIIFLQTKRSERTKINLPRIEKKAISALKQSENVFMPEFLGPVDLKNIDSLIPQGYTKYVAHISKEELKYNSTNIQNAIVIGPEGGFEPSEVEFLITKGYKPLSLGDSILRTETAGIIAAFLFSRK